MHKKRVGVPDEIFDAGWVDQREDGPALFVKQPKVRQEPRPIGRPEDTIKYMMPRVGAEVEKQSFRWHVQKMNLGKSRPSNTTRNRAKHLMEMVYDKARWCVPEHWDSDDSIRAKIWSVKPDGSPGPRFIKYGSTNKEVLKALGVESILTMVKQRIRDLKFQPLRVFIKQEPTKIAKVQEGRPRLIWCFDLIDQLLCALVYDPSMTNEIAAYEEIPSKMGLSFSNGAWHQFIQTCKNSGEDWMEMDKTAWDWSVPEWLFQDAREMRWSLCINQHDNTENVISFKRVFDACYEYQSKVTVQFSDGVTVSQTVPAIQKSGSKTTISDNSKWQKYLRVLWGIDEGLTEKQILEDVACMGDDTLEQRPREPEKYIRCLEKWGFYPKPEEISYGPPDKLNFCSHTSVRYKNQFVPVPTNWNKQLWNLQWKDCSDEAYVQALQSMLIDWAFVPEKFQCLLEELKRVAPTKVRSKGWYQGVTLGFD